MQKNKGEEQRERNGQRDNDRCAHAHQEENQHDEHQDHPQEQIVFHGVDGQAHQVAAIVVRHDFHVRRQDVLVQLFGFGLDAFQNILRLFAARAS